MADKYKLLEMPKAEMERYTMDDLRNMNPFTLDHLIDVLERAFDHLLPKKCEDVVLAFGNTGCGKSTLLGAIIMGPHSLELK